MRYTVTCAALAVAALSPNAAAVVIHHSVGDFLDATHPNYYFENFTSMSPGSPGTIATFGPVNGYAFTAFAEDGLYSNGNYLSTFAAWDELVLIFTGDPVHAVGGYIWGSDVNFNTIPGEVQVTISGDTTISLFDPTPDTFIGFTSDTEITWMTIRAWATFAFPTLNDFYVGTHIPGPGGLALLVLAALAKTSRRRRSSRPQRLAAYLAHGDQR